MKILLLEDNKRLSNLIIEALEEKGYKVSASGEKPKSGIRSFSR